MTAAIDTRATSLVVRPYVFRKEDWKRDGARVIPGTPGTWCDVRGWKDAPKGLLALYRCPACLGTLALHKKVHTIDSKGGIRPDLVCTASARNSPLVLPSGTAASSIPCSFHRKAYLDRWSDKPLYAVALERETKGGTWVPEIHYTHARTHDEARFHLGNLGGRYRIVALGPALGFFTEDPKGETLTTD